MDQNTLSLEKPVFISHWNTNNAKYALFIDESGNHDIDIVDPNWPILSLFGVIIRYDNYIKLKKKLLDLRCELWPPHGKFDYECNEGTANKQVYFHSRDMRRKEGPFADKVLSPEKRRHMDTVLWEKIISKYQWIGLSCIIDKNKLCAQYRYPANPYTTAVIYMLERLVITIKEPSLVIFEKRGKREDAHLWSSLKMLFTSGTLSYVYPREFIDRIDNIGWHSKHSSSGNVVAGLEIADLCAYILGANYLRGNCRFQENCGPKLLGYPNNIRGRGLKIFPE